MNNKLEVIGIDHGWSMMKTVTQVFVTGVKEITTTPALFGDVLEYDGKYYKPKGFLQQQYHFLSHIGTVLHPLFAQSPLLIGKRGYLVRTNSLYIVYCFLKC